MKQTLLTSVAVLAMASSAAQAAIILQDSFTGSDGSLSGRPLEIAQVPGDSWNIDNTQAGRAVVASNVLVLGQPGGYAKATAPFNDAAVTDPFTLSYDLAFNPGADSSSMFWGGFGRGATNGATFADFAIGPGFTFGTSTSGDWSGTSATLNTVAAGDGSPWGSGAGSVILTRPDTSSLFMAHLAVTYNPVTSEATFFINGSQVGAPTSYTGAIGGVWFKADDIGSGGSGIHIDNIQISSIPETSTYGLLFGLGAIFFALRTRNQRK